MDNQTNFRLKLALKILLKNFNTIIYKFDYFLVIVLDIMIIFQLVSIFANKKVFKLSYSAYNNLR